MAKIQREVEEGLRGAPAIVREMALKHRVEVRLLHDAEMEV